MVIFNCSVFARLAFVHLLELNSFLTKKQFIGSVNIIITNIEKRRLKI